MRRTAEDTAKTREKLLDVSLKVFGQKGYAATNLSDIAKEANLTRGAIYHHFNCKAELFSALMDRYQKKTMEAIKPLLISQENSIDKLKKGMLEYFILLENDIGMLEFQKIQMTERVILKYINEFDKAKEHVDKYMAHLQNLIKEGQEKSEIKSDVIPDEFIFFLISFIFGVLNHWMFFGRNFELSVLGFKYIESFIESHLRPDVA